ncbi:MAG: DUF4234 domain-containing protein [Clostridia bacterium]
MNKGRVREPLQVLLLSIITCGIYFLYWLYITADEIRVYLQDESINPGMELLLSIICFPYVIYWFYKFGKLAGTAQAKAGEMVDDNSTLFILLAIFGLTIVGAMIMQGQLNKVWTKNSAIDL